MEELPIKQFINKYLLLLLNNLATAFYSLLVYVQPFTIGEPEPSPL
jgi:hypothetical protein